MKSPLIALCFVGVLAWSACSAKTDYGQTCKMTKPSGGVVVPITVGELSNPALDYIALGSAECDDLVCLRTANPVDAYPDEGGNAMGYCTAGCLTDQDCQPDFQGKGDLKCSQLLLSDAYLQALKDQDPEAYDRIFGSGASSKYCVKARTSNP